MPSSLGSLARLDQQAGGLLRRRRRTCARAGCGCSSPAPPRAPTACRSRAPPVSSMIFLSSSSLSSANDAHAELGERAADGVARLDRMHEVQVRVGDRRRVLDLGQRGDVEMADAGAVQRADQEHGAVRLVGVGDVTGELFEKPPRGAPAACGRRPRPAARAGTCRSAQMQRRASPSHRTSTTRGRTRAIARSRDRRTRKSAAFRGRFPPVKSFLVTGACGASSRLPARRHHLALSCRGAT